MSVFGKKQAEEIVVVKKVTDDGGADHKGGAWKLAYADFVTAMMAFFLLMWLLSSPKPSDLAGLADYFTVAKPFATQEKGQSSSQSSATTSNSGGKANKEGKAAGEEVSKLPNSMLEMARQEIAAQKDALDRKRLEDIKTQMQEVISKDPQLKRFKENILLQTSLEGLLIQLVDGKRRPMFDTGSAQMRPYAAEILSRLTRVLNEVENKLVISGHTDAKPFNGRGGLYTNWELSTDRANASRRALVQAGLREDRVMRVTGMASANPLVADPQADINRRIEILVLTQRASVAGLQRDILEGLQQPARRDY